MDQIQLFKVFMSPDVIKPLNDVLMSGYITQGSMVEKFEDELKKVFNYPYILTLNSGTSGLTLAYRLIKDKYNLDDSCEVISVPFTCSATNFPIIANSLNIKWVDIDKETGLIDLVDLQKKLTENTKIITFVHWGGYPVDLDKLNIILDEHYNKYHFRPIVVEDCAHAFLSEYKGKLLGTHGNFAVFSLQAIKHLTCVDGGLIFCPNKDYYDKAKLLRWYGIDRDKRNYNKKDFRLEHDIIDWGYKFHMNDVNATIGLYNLPHIKQLIEKNRNNARYFDQQLSCLDGLKILNKYDNDKKSSYWLYTILIKNKDIFIEYMKNKNIIVSQVHQRNDIYSAFDQFKIHLPNMDEIEKSIVCIPVGWWLTETELNHIVETIKNFLHII